MDWTARQVTMLWARRLVPLVVLLAVGGILLHKHISRRLLSDEERIRAAVLDLADAAEERHANRFLSHISKDEYRDRFHRDYQHMDGNIRAMAFRYREVRVELSDLTVEIDKESGDPPTRAKATFRARIRLGLTKGEEPQSALVESARGSDRFQLDFVREDDGEWRIVRSGLPDDTADR